MRVVGWVVFAALLVIAIMSSIPDQGLREGHQGSYLGRNIADSGVGKDHAQDLNQRARRVATGANTQAGDAGS
ncbi:MAG TPA: hypothetical protein VF342_11590 [Alphaproteobacteria bacterium]